MNNQPPRKLIEEKTFRWQHPEKPFFSRCDLEIHRRGNGAVVVATERIDDNAACVSVTNGAEHIAKEAVTALIST